MASHKSPKVIAPNGASVPLPDPEAGVVKIIVVNVPPSIVTSKSYMPLVLSCVSRSELTSEGIPTLIS